MRVAVLGFGSRGDVQPLLAIALRLRERGHEVVMTAPQDFTDPIARHDLPFHSIPVNINQLLEGEIGQDMMRKGTSLPRMMVAIPRLTRELGEKLRSANDPLESATAEADVILTHGLLTPFAYSVHELRGVPLFMTTAVPLLTTSAFPAPLFPQFGKQPNLYNRLSFSVALPLLFGVMIGPANDWRKRVGLAPLSLRQFLRIYQRLPTVLTYSSHVIPKPADWGVNIHITGYSLLPTPQDWQPSEAMQTFLSQGPPPIFIGFGSMKVPQPQETARIIIEALHQSEQRGILQAGWGGLRLDDLSHDHVLQIGDAPHDWLFSRMSAIVHHGGASTTGAALRSGNPSLIVPFIGDQPFWGNRVAALGAGLSPIPFRRLTVERLAAAFRQLTTDASLRRHAYEVGRALQAEDGASAAANIIATAH